MSTTPISCISKEPFTKLEESGSASILNYNLPQKTTGYEIYDFSVYFKNTELPPGWKLPKEYE